MVINLFIFFKLKFFKKAMGAVILSSATFFYISKSDYLLPGKRNGVLAGKAGGRCYGPKHNPQISNTGGLGKRKSRNPPIYLIIRCFFHYLHLHIKTDTQSGLMILVAIFSIHIFPRGNFRLCTYILKGANFKRS